MAGFPPIMSPCLLRWRALPEQRRDYCTFCEKRVHNLDRLSEPERDALLASHSGSICVAYTVQRAAISVIAGAGIAATLAAAPAGAEAPAIEDAYAQMKHDLSLFPISVGGTMAFEPNILDREAFERALAGKPAEFVAPPNKLRRRAR